MTNYGKVVESLLNLVKEDANQQTKISYKINFQKEEIIKTESLIEKFQECLQQQNNMLNQFHAKAIENKSEIKLLNKIKLQKEEIIKTEDLIEKFQDCIQQQNNMLNQFYTKESKIRNHAKELLKTVRDMDKNNGDKHWLKYLDMCNANVKLLINSIIDNSDNNIELISPVKPEGSLKRNNLVDVEELEVEKKIIKTTKLGFDEFEEKSIFDNSDFIKKCNPQLIHTIKECGKIFRLLYHSDCIYIGGSNGFLLKYYLNDCGCIEKGTVKALNTQTKENILNIAIYDEFCYAFSVDEMMSFDKSLNKSIVRKFDCRILNICKRKEFILISLEDGVVLKYKLFAKTFEEIYRTNERLKAFLCLQTDYYMILKMGGKVSIQQGRSKKINLYKLYGSVDIQEMRKQRTLCIKNKSICILDNMKHEIITKLAIGDVIRSVEVFDNIISILDQNNKLHFYKFKESSFEMMDIIEFPADYNVTAIFLKEEKEVYIAVNNQIFKLKM